MPRSPRSTTRQTRTAGSRPGRSAARVISATLGGVTAVAPVVVTPATLIELAIDATTTALPIGQARCRSPRIGRYTGDGTSQDVTGEVTWSSSAPSLIAVSNAANHAGVVTALLPGAAVVTAIARRYVG